MKPQKTEQLKFSYWNETIQNPKQGSEADEQGVKDWINTGQIYSSLAKRVRKYSKSKS